MKINILSGPICFEQTRLSEVKAYNKNGLWYLAATWEYIDEKGRRMKRHFPKIEFPFSMFSLPLTYQLEDNDDHSGSIVVAVDYTPRGFPAEYTLEDGSVVKAPKIDIVIDEQEKEMTIDEVEKELGRKIKIVGDDKNG